MCDGAGPDAEANTKLLPVKKLTATPIPVNTNIMDSFKAAVLPKELLIILTLIFDDRSYLKVCEI